MSTGDPCEVEFQPIGKRVSMPRGATLLEAARHAGIDLTSACGGEGNCGQCQVILLAGHVDPPSEDDEFFLPEEDLARGYRLACRTLLHDSLKVHLPKDSLITGQRLQIESNLRLISPDPAVRSYALRLHPASLEDNRSDLTRLKDTLQEEHGLGDLDVGVEAARCLPSLLRTKDWQITACLRQDEIIAFLPAGARPLGLAVDLGTTKIAAILVDLESGVELASAGAPNPQISYGEDVISRLNLALRDPSHADMLAEKVRTVIDEMLGELLTRAGAGRDQVVEACIVGNTAMSHLLLALPVRQLAVAPYVAAVSDTIEVPAAAIGLRAAPGARVIFPPVIGGYVGADHVAMALACDLDQSDKTVIGLDIGTNTEISLHVQGQSGLVSTSCASGPAFEGAHIRDGMRAATGAIEKVRITPRGPELTTIDNEPAVGLCGSGILDSMAELYRTGFLNTHGRFDRSRDQVRQANGSSEFVLVPAGKSGSGRDIVITQNDVNEIQLAKGAIQAGMSVLIEAAGISSEAVQEVIVAGAFGSFLNIENAVRIGLFPSLPNAQYRQVGNAAALGAKWILISRDARRRAEDLARSARYLELTVYPKFSSRFARAMLFPAQTER